MRKIKREAYLEAIKRMRRRYPHLFYIRPLKQKTDNINSLYKKAFVYSRRVAGKLYRKLEKAVRQTGSSDQKSNNNQPKIKASEIKFSKHVKPDVSVVIPVLDKLDITLRCLKGLAAHKSEHSFEVVLVNNGSEAVVAKTLKKVKNLRLINLESNQGFVGGCNIGAKKAKGSILVFLNNDTEVIKGWLDNLVKHLDDPLVGLVGSKLIYPNGTLQEAGGIIFSDGSGNNYGKHQDANSFAFNYTAEVDYVSGASIAIKNKLFKSFGGFDKIYSPAYYEDTDLAFKVRQKGLKVIFEPDSLVIHIEGATGGTDTEIGGGFKKYQYINKEKFEKRWAKELKKQPDSSENIFIARTHRFKARVLFIDNSLPEPDKDSGSVREWAILTLLKELGCHVTFWPANLVASQPYTSRLQSMGIEVAYGSEVDFENIMQQRAGAYSHVFIARPFVGCRFIDLVKQTQPQAKVLYDTVDLHYLRVGRQAELKDSIKLQDEAKDWEIIEKYLISKSSETLVVSPIEKDILEEAGYKNISILSNIHTFRSLSKAPPFSKRKGLLFIGNFSHPPNVDAIKWFCQKILPLVQAKIPKVHLSIVGSNMPPDVYELAKKPGITAYGYVENVDPIFDGSKLFISPLRYGAGVKGKLGQSISLGLPIVTTSVGSEGMYLEDKRDCLIADDEASFAEAIVNLYSNQILWSGLQKSAQQTLKKHMSTGAAKKALEKLLA